jgi:hypothetical protein
MTSISFEYCNSNLYLLCKDEEEKLAKSIHHMFSTEKECKISSTLGGLDKVKVICTNSQELMFILNLLTKHKYISNEEGKKLYDKFKNQVSTKITI